MIRTKVTIGGNDVIDYRDINISRTMSKNTKVSNFSLTVDTPFGRHANDFTVGQEVIIYANKDASPTTKIFQGVLEKKTYQGEGTYQTLQLMGRDYSLRFLDITVEPVVYTDTEISAIVSNIISNNVSDITTTNVTNTGVVLKRIAFNHSSVFEALNQLAEFVDFVFYVDESKDLHFMADSSSSSGVTLTNQNILRTTFNQTREGMANSIWVYGDRQLAGRKEVIEGGAMTNGSVMTLLAKPHNTNVMISNYPGSVLKGGIFELTTTPTSGPDYLVSFHDRQIIFQSGTALGYSSIPEILGGSAVINYDAEVPIVKFGENNASISAYGKKVKIINDKTIKDPNTAVSILKAELNNSDPFRGMEIQYQGWNNFTPGQTVDVVLSDFGINDTVSINEVFYKFDKYSINSENVITLKLDKDITDITDRFTSLNDRLTLIEAQDRQDTDVFTRLESTAGSFTVVGSHYNVYTRELNDSFILGHPYNGVLGIVQPNHIGNLISGVTWSGVHPFRTGGAKNSVVIPFMEGTGSRSFIDIPGASGLNHTTDLTVNAWMYPYTSAQTETAHIMSKYSFTNNQRQWILGWNVNGSFTFEWFASGTGTPNTARSFGADGIVMNVWNNISAVFRGGSVDLYWNGSLRESTVSSVNQIYNLGSGPVRIGGNVNAGNGSNFFSGLIADCAYYNRALTQEDIGSIYEQGITYSVPNTISGLLGYWKLGEGAGSIVYNSANGSSTIQPLLGDRRGDLILNTSGGYF